LPTTPRKPSPAVPRSFDKALLLRHARWLKNVPYLSPDMAPHLPAVVARLIEFGADDFTWSSDFSPAFLANLMRHGFLTMATSVRPQ